MNHIMSAKITNNFKNSVAIIMPPVTPPQSSSSSPGQC